ncbi:MAG: hypothetical protein ACK4GN_02865 [Runella sp.]
MKPIDDSHFEAQWRRAFDDATQTPPDRVWERVEAALDNKEQEKPPFLFLFWQRVRWVAAASVLIGVGYYFSNKIDLPHSQKLSSVGNATENENKPLEKTKKGFLAKRSSEKPQNEISRSNKSLVMSRQNDFQEKNPTQKKQFSPTAAIPSDESSFVRKKYVLTPSNSNQLNIVFLTDDNAPSFVYQNTSANQPTFEVNVNLTAAVLPNQRETTASLMPLEIKEWQPLRGVTEKIPWVALPKQESTEIQSKSTNTKQYWASVGIMPSAYNAGLLLSPSVGALAQNMSGTARLAIPSEPLHNNRAAASYALQWNGGIQWSQRWSVETGLHYLQGNSVYESISGFDVFTNSYVNNLETAMRYHETYAQRYSLATINSDKAQIQSFPTLQSTQNSFQYLQIPAQVGYAMTKPKRRFSLWLLGGIINNLFLSNRFETGQEKTLTLKGSESPYRTLSFSSSAGLRMQYRLNTRLSATLTGNYQRALGSHTASDALLEARPQLLGVGAGVKYGF